MDCCFDSAIACNTHVSSPVTTRLKKLSFSSLYCVRKSNTLVCCFNLCTSVSIFGTQCEHNFRNLSLSDTILLRSDREIWGKCKVSDVMVNRLFSLIFSSTACTKSSFTTDGRPLSRSSCTYSRPSLNSHTHPRTIQLLMACSPYTPQSWWRISAGFMFFAYKKWITDGFTCGRILYFLKHYTHTAQCMNTVQMSAYCVWALPQNQKLGTYAHHCDCRVAETIFANWTYFLDNPSTSSPPFQNFKQRIS